MHRSPYVVVLNSIRFADLRAQDLQRFGMPRRSYYTYALSNERRNVLYIGVTGNLHLRLAQHRAAETPGFTKQYRVHDLVWYEPFGYVYDAIKREKQLKAWRREWKWALIREVNPEVRDLTDTLLLL